MGLSQEVRSLFSSITRQRGEEYLQSGAVDLMTAEPDHVHLVVDGSRGREYDVTLDRFDIGEYHFDCSCPHYQDGNHCKHLWAAVRLVEDQRLLTGRQAAAPPEAGRPKRASWPTDRLGETLWKRYGT